MLLPLAVPPRVLDKCFVSIKFDSQESSGQKQDGFSYHEQANTTALKAQSVKTAEISWLCQHFSSQEENLFFFFF